VESKIITAVNQKGGAGKSTLSMQVAGTMAKDGWRVIVIDADPQGTATRWAAAAEDDRPFPAPVVGLSSAGAKVHREAKKFVGEYAFIFIDCPPAVDSPIPQSALLIADLALIPIIPSPPDLWAAVGIRHLLTSLKAINDSMQPLLVVNSLEPQTLIAQDVQALLPEFEIPVAESLIHHRTAYRRSAAFGTTVHGIEPRDTKAIVEIEHLTAEIYSRLGVQDGRAKISA
jgi:chromosome partitioning protein